MHLAHATTARLHSQQLNRWHSQQAAQRVTNVFPQWDEGAVGGYGNSQPGLLAGCTGNVDGDPERPYTDMLGLEVLPGKTGQICATGMLAILKRRGFDTGLGYCIRV